LNCALLPNRGKASSSTGARNAKPFRISQKAVVIGDFQRADDKYDELIIFFTTEFRKK